MRNKKTNLKNVISIILAISMFISSLSGCGRIEESGISKDADDCYLPDDNIDIVSRLENIDENAYSQTSSLYDDEVNIEIIYEKQVSCFDNLKESVENEEFENALEYLDDYIELSDSLNSLTENWFEEQKQIPDLYFGNISESARVLIDERCASLEETINNNKEYEEECIEYIRVDLASGDKETALAYLEELDGLLNFDPNEYGTSNYDSNKIIKEESSEEIIVQSNGEDSDLLNEGDTALNDRIIELTDDLATPLGIYYYLKQNIDYEYYYGARKGAANTLESMAGNDYDQASLMISMLRYLGYRAKYVKGYIQIDEEQALDITGADTLENAANILSSAGVPVTKLTKKGNVIGLKIEHVWVRTEIPYTNYRGCKPAGGKKLWIDFDTGIKSYNNKTTISDIVQEKYIDDFKGELSLINNEDEIVDLVNRNIELINSEDFSDLGISKRNIVPEIDIYLPLSMQYDVLEEESVFATISNEDKDSVTFEFDGYSLGTYTATELTGKNVQLYFAPASNEDAEIFELYSSIFDIPASYVYFVPVLFIDGIEVSRGDYANYTLGDICEFTLNMNFKGNVIKKELSINNNVSVGSMYAITFDAQNISPYNLYDSYEDIYNVARNITGKKVYTTSCLGEYLSFVGKVYFSEVDIINNVSADSLNVAITRRLSEGITGYEVKRSISHGKVIGVLPGNLFIDIDANDTIAVSRDNNAENVTIFNAYSGYTSSIYESIVWEQLTGVESVSTVSVFENANKENIEIVDVSKDNIERLNEINISYSLKNELAGEIENGSGIIIPLETVEIGNWNGTGYILINDGNQSEEYMISGGLNGGVLPVETHIGVITTEITAVMSAITLINAIESTALSRILPIESKFAVDSIKITTMSTIALLNTYMIEYMATGDAEYIPKIQDMLMLLATLSMTEFLFADLIYSYFIPLQQEPDAIPDSAKNYYNDATDLDNGFEGLDAEVQTLELEEGIWDNDSAIERGNMIDEKAGNNLGHNYPTFDNIEKSTGTATSVKSRDITCQSYQSRSGLESTIKRDIDRVYNFDNTKPFSYNNKEIKAGEINERVLKVVVPDVQLSEEQIEAINNAVEYGKSKNVEVIIVIGVER